MGRVKGDLSHGGGRCPSRIKGNLQRPNWDHQRRGKKKIAKANRGEIIKVAKKTKEKIRNSDLPKSKKESLIRDINRKIGHLRSPEGAIVKHYNKLAKFIEKGRRIVNQNINTKNTNTNSVNVNAGPGAPKVDGPPISATDKGVREANKPAAVREQESVQNNASSSGKSKKKEGHSKAFKNFKPEEFAELMTKDPQAAMDQLEKMGPEEMGLAMTMAQQHLQKINRMIQAYSNMSKMVHNTQSAVIRNLQ